MYRLREEMLYFWPQLETKIMNEGWATFWHVQILREMDLEEDEAIEFAAMHARHVALNAYYTTKAEAAGLETPEGLKLLEIADRQSQRAERVLVTCLDVATKMAKKADATDGGSLLADFTRGAT